MPLSARVLAMLLWLVVLAVPAGSARAEGPHCWCRINKSDCGDCNPACQLYDFGAVAQFGTFQTGKEDLCKAACKDKLASMTEPEVCTDLATNLSVPRPWAGEVHNCWNVGAGSWAADQRRTVSCPVLPPQVGPVYPPPGARSWKTTHFDDFKGKPANASPEVADCYDRTASCVRMYRSGPEACESVATANLKNLDKCTWTVLRDANWMGPDTSRFDAREVRVEPLRDNGVLILSAHAVRPDGSYASTGPTHTRNGQVLADDPLVRRKDLESGYDCESSEWNQPMRIKCPITVGAVISQPSNSSGPKGFEQLYGRFSSRTRVAYGAGAFPALWMLPSQGSWPGAGELDVMESRPGGDYVWQTLHTGNCFPSNLADLDPDACVAGGGSRWHLSKDGGKIYPSAIPDHTPFWSGYHVFAVEWGPSSLKFSVDGVVNNEIKDLDYIRGTKSGVAHHWWNKGTWEKWMPAHIPASAFYWLLNVAVHDEDGKYPNPKNFVPQEMFVDWTRAEQACLTRADFCPTGGDLEISSNRCVSSSTSTTPSPYDSPCRQ